MTKNKEWFWTADNTGGVGAIVSYEEGKDIIVLPGREENSLIIWKNGEKKEHVFDKYDAGISTIAINNAGSLIAKSSSCGKYIRMIKVEDCEEIKRYTRGSSVAQITSLFFDNSSKYLTASSNLETIHVFTVPIVQWDKDLAESSMGESDSLVSGSIRSSKAEEV